MKKSLIKIIVPVLFLGGLSSCQDKLEELYSDPEKTENASIEKFFTQILNNERVYPQYWDIRTFVVNHTARYSQFLSYNNENKRYQQQIDYTQSRWNSYYTQSQGSGMISHYREVEKAYNALSAENKKVSEVYLQASKIALMDQTLQMIDLWGDMPFSEAGSLNATGNIVLPKFDKAKDVYAAALTGLKEASDFFANNTLNAGILAGFKKQDILLAGDTDKWRRYANSLRLRALMRLSFVDEAGSKAAVLEMLNNPTTYPLVDESKYNVLLNPTTDYNDNLRNALNDFNSMYATPYLLNTVLKPAKDPRIEAIYDKYGAENAAKKFVQNADFNAMPLDIPSNEQTTNITAGKYAVLDSTTFLFNTKLPGVVFTAAETNFLKAEALERWGSSADAATAYNKGVKQSVEFYYFLNNTNTTRAEGKLTVPSAAVLDALVVSASVAYTGTAAQKLEKIWVQKWVNFGFLQSIQSWAEVRRTKYPQLTFVRDSNTPDAPLPPSRLLYPGSEKAYNAANYSAVAASDLATAKIFWDVK